MKPHTAMIAAAMIFAFAGTLSAQTASTSTTTSNAGAYDALPEGNRKIVSAIYESQFGSPNDTAGGTLLTRDDIAAMKQDTGWGNAYRRMYEQGLVSERNLGQAISSRNHSTTTSGGVTVVTTAGGEQTAVGKGKADGKAAGSTASGPAKPGNGQGAATRSETSRSTVVTTAGGSTAGANAAAANSSAGGVSRAGGNGNGQAVGKSK